MFWSCSFGKLPYNDAITTLLYTLGTPFLRQYLLINIFGSGAYRAPIKLLRFSKSLSRSSFKLIWVKITQNVFDNKVEDFLKNLKKFGEICKRKGIIIFNSNKIQTNISATNIVNNLSTAKCLGAEFTCQKCWHFLEAAYLK